jgi:hypothetical protein
MGRKGGDIFGLAALIGLEGQVAVRLLASVARGFAD